jgi:uncharacterized protein (DUF1501 family)
MPVLSGAAPIQSWVPDQELSLTQLAKNLLQEDYADDPVFHAASAQAFDLAGMAVAEGRDADLVAGFVAERLREAARIAVFSLNGWDTHKAQGRSLRGPPGQRQTAILRLRQDLGPGIWAKTAVLAMTEFGRTVHENGSGGTDHGTGGAMLAAAGAVRGGRVLGRWPGLAEADLYDRRDLMPTSDIRDWAAQALTAPFRIDRSLLETTVFPGLKMEASPRLFL